MLEAIRVPDERTDPTEKHQSLHSNHDLDPTPPEQRIWSKWTFLAFWVAHAAGAGSWTAGSSIIALGLSPIVAWVTLATSHVLITALIVLNGRMSARYHCGFPVFSRTAYGMWGSYMAVGMRAVVCIIWNGTNSYYASRLVWVAIACIWPKWRTLPNALPASAAITSTQLASFAILMLVFISMSFIHARDLNIWWMKKSGGEQFTQFKTKEMSHDSWLWLAARSFNAGLGAASSLTVNQGDMTRYATKPGDAIWTTLFGYSIASALPCLYGILVASAAKKITGTAYWNLWQTLEYMLDQYLDNSGARFGIFLASGALALSYIGVNLATNCLPFGSDLTALFPRYFTIIRGQVLCTILGVAIVPWKILASAQAFVTFLSGYGYWLAPIAGVLFADYYVVAKGNVDVSQLYTSNPHGRYWYARGWNWRAVATTILSLLPCLPGFAAQLTTSNLGISHIGKNLFYVSFILTYTLSVVLYLSFSFLFPRAYTKEHNLRSQHWEQLADEGDAREAEDRQLAAVEDASSAEAKDIDGSMKEAVESVAYVEPAREEVR
ncbi:hypothetical protein JCM10207_006102 [Rhodosporidiobolus poonsookiae]